MASAPSSLLGLRAASPNFHAPYYLLGNFVFAHFILVQRSFKQYYGIDHNENPRDDISKYAAEAIRSGKLTPQQLETIKRAGAAHSNRVENYAVFAAATVLAVSVGVDNAFVNTYGLLYTLSSVAYGAAYVCIATTPLSLARTAAWYAGCWACFRLFWEAAKVGGRK